ncbi:MAG: competence/damage-inducible protein A [Candidatus Eisenbacteria bacterium]
MRIEIVTIGNEVLSGRTLDTNFAFLARACEQASVAVGWHTTVGDSADAIGTAVRQALDRADALIMTGGLGPTPDDLTRKAVAAVLRRPLQLDEQVLAAIRARIKKLNRELPASIETQALLPRGAEVWPNSRGTAPGILILHKDKPVILLPGVPGEMEALATEHVVPYLRERTGLTVESFTLRTFGVFESMLQEHIGKLPRKWSGASLAYLPSFFGVDLRVTSVGPDADTVREVIGRAYDELKAGVRGVLYAEGDTGMERVAGEALLKRGWKIATAESCTGGLLAKRLTDTPGSSRTFERGWVTYSNEAKMQALGTATETIAAHGAVSAAVAEQMARGARERSGAEVGVGLTGIAGPDGATAEKPVGLVFIAVASPLGDAVRRYQFVGTRATVRERSTQTSLDLVRRHLAGLPLDPALE